MLACTALLAVMLGKPEVMTPSNHEPTSEALLSPPVPSMIAPSWRMGMYADGREPSHHVDRPPVVESPPSSANAFCPLFWSMAVTNGVAFPRLLVFEPPLLIQIPFSRSACTHGPLPEQGLTQH